MNYKLEKFWNIFDDIDDVIDKGWTINLKSFEIIIVVVTCRTIKNEL